MDFLRGGIRQRNGKTSNLKAPIAMKRLFLVLFLLASIVPCILSAQNVLSGQVTKHDTHGNPSLGIVSFSGDAATRQLLERILQRTDWFKLVGADQAARAQIQLKVSGSPQNLIANVVVAGKSPFTISGTGETAQDSVFQLVDALLKQIFKVPALCKIGRAHV